MAMPRTCRARWLLTAGLAALILCASLLPPARGQLELPSPRAVRPSDENGGEKSRPEGPDILPQSYPGGMYPGIPVRFPDVLNLAVMSNLDIARANLALEQARVALLAANAQFLPNLGVGSTYVAHDGQIQNTAGNVSTVNRDSLFVGGGPSISLPLARALFGPQEARQLRDAALFGRARVTNEVLLAIVDAYFNVLRARRQLARLDEVLDFLTSEQESPLRGSEKSPTRGLLPLIKSFVKTGARGGLPSDQARVEADVVRRQAERVRALEELRAASAELSRLLHLNAGYFLIPAEDYRWPVPVTGQGWFEQPVEVLVTQGLRSRPEIGENQALLAAAMTRYRATKWEPLLPTLSSNLSWGGFGGGPPITQVRRTTVLTPGGGTTTVTSNVLGNSGVIADFGPRTDFDISLFWRLEGGGLGNLARIRQARLRSMQVELRQLQIQDLVVSQVVRAMERLQRAEQRVNIYSAGLFDENRRPNGTVYRSIRLNFVRIKGGEGIPLEVLDSIRRLSDVLEGYANALSDLDRARYRLLLVLGLPPAGLLDPSCLPLPPAPPPRPAEAVAGPGLPGKLPPPSLGEGTLPMPRALPPVLAPPGDTVLAPGVKPAESRSFLDTLLNPIMRVLAPAPAPAPAAARNSLTAADVSLPGEPLPAIGQPAQGRGTGASSGLGPPRFRAASGVE